MQASATARYVRLTPRKVRFVLDTIRGKYAQDALDQLRFTPNFAADEIANVLRSAIANAEHNYNMDTQYLKVVRCFVDPGPTLKRVQPRAQGRAYRILKRTSHITVIVEEASAPVVKTGKRKEKKPPLRAALPGTTNTVATENTAPAESVYERDEQATAPATETVTETTDNTTENAG
jgi:large subunit ribosomal protein L22